MTITETSDLVIGILIAGLLLVLIGVVFITFSAANSALELRQQGRQDCLQDFESAGCRLYRLELGRD